MGVFYNPPQPMPLSQLGYEDQPFPKVGLRGKPVPKEHKRDLAAEKADAWNQAALLGDGDPKKTAEAMSKLGYPEDAVKYLDANAKQEDANLTVQTHELDARLRATLTGADLVRNGQEGAGITLMNRWIDDPAQKITDAKYDKKTDNLVYTTADGNTNKINVTRSVETAVSAETRYKEDAAMRRLVIQKMKDPKTKTPNEHLGEAQSQMLLTENMMRKTGKSKEEVWKLNPDLELTPYQRRLIAEASAGNLVSAAATAAANSPELIGAWQQMNKGKDPTEFIVGITTKAQKAFAKEFNIEPQAGGSNTPVKRGGVKESVSMTETTHPERDAQTTRENETVQMRHPETGKVGPVSKEQSDYAKELGYTIVE